MLLVMGNQLHHALKSLSGAPNARKILRGTPPGLGKCQVQPPVQGKSLSGALLELGKYPAGDREIPQWNPPGLGNASMEPLSGTPPGLGKSLSGAVLAP